MFQNQHIYKRLIALTAVIVLIFLIWLRFSYASSFARSWDAVDFALGVKSFDLLAMQPHFPGYPYFIMGGMLVHQWVEDLTQSLSFWNGLMAFSSIIPTWLLFKNYLPKEKALLLTSICQSIPFVNIIVASPMSEGTAISIVWWYLWALDRSLNNQRWIMSIFAALLFSLLMGVRLSYFPFGIGLVILWYQLFKKHSYSFVLSQVGLALLFQSVWIIALIQSIGGVESFLYIAFEFVKGHFVDWGGSVVASDLSIWSRFTTFLFTNIIWVGFLGKSILQMALVIGLIFISLFQRTRVEARLPSYFWVLWICYGLWAFFGQNIDKPRHALPLIALGVGILGFYALRYHSKLIPLWMAGMMLVNLNLSDAYVKKQATELPATYQLAYDINQMDRSLILYTWEEERVFDYLHVQMPYKKIKTYTLFKEELQIQKKKGREVLLTDKVVAGFVQQGYHVQKNIEPVRVYHSNPMFDPVYSEIILYRWVPSSSSFIE